ncbi:hypothetical protein PLICRDRAFT_151828 [Plicaturopsis crispa FD-325 SS-3]|nr:hypothetical protein PLICRDRAFT_151828 [Plicaturopsis crispa FD-325 SS-3]
MWSLEQVAQHNNAQSCWVIIQDKVYDVTEFLPGHPGGSKIILKYAGQDATSAYVPIHPSDALEKNLPPNKHLGSLDVASAQALSSARESKTKTKDEIRVEAARNQRPPLTHILSLRDMEIVARKVLSFKALSYYASAADDELTDSENALAFSRFFFHPRVLRAVSACDPSTTILGFKSTIPVFACGAALAKLGHPLGEINITIGAHHTGIIQMVSSNASFSSTQIAAARPSPTQPIFFQLYKHRDNEVAARRVREVEAEGYKAIFLTVDAIVAGNRERDLRAGWVEEEMENAGAVGGGKTVGEMPRRPEDLERVEDAEAEAPGTAGTLLANDDVDMTWKETIPWLRSVTKLPLVLKGIQSVEDAVLAAEAGVDGIMLSNHGGRQLEYALPPIELLYKIRQQRPDVLSKMEVYIDGGVRRGTDVLKALCLGARAVGLGRPFMYGQSAYGAAGVVKTVRILEREIVTGMRLLGATSVAELVPEMVERVDWQPIAPKL